jgi:hypothetical protein
MWFNKNDVLKHFDTMHIIELADLNGYVLPHAGTTYTGHIIAHTMRFKPTKQFSKVYILFYPANPNETHETAHEYEVPYKSCLTIFKKIWKINTSSIEFIPYNIGTSMLSRLTLDEYQNSLVIVSADFSHFLDLQTAYKTENCAANAIMHNATPLPKCTEVVDHRDTFMRLYSFLPSTVQPLLQWIGRTRSPGIKGVGYLSFLLRKKHLVNSSKLPDGMFVSCYDENMTARECLGKWFDNGNTKKWTKTEEKSLIIDVVRKGHFTSRLTGGKSRNNVPIKYCTVTYLYRDLVSQQFIRGWHGLLASAFYLPDVFLEYTYDNGKWIKEEDKEWPQDYNFRLDETLSKLDNKAGVQQGTSSHNKQKLYTSALKYIKINNKLLTQNGVYNNTKKVFNKRNKNL